MKYIVSLLMVSLCFSCTALKKNVEEEQIVQEVVEEVVESTVPDYITEDIEPQGDCKEDWRLKDRKIIYWDEARIKRMEEATDGIISITARVGRDGYVDFAKIELLSTTVKNQKVLNMAKEIVEGIQFEPSETAPKNDCGVVKFNLNRM